MLFFEQLLKVIQLSLMTTDKNKLVQNYYLEDLKQIYPDDSQVWTAKHKILKKSFTLKRVKYRTNAKELQSALTTSRDNPEIECQKLLNESNLLKRLNVQFVPKCYKMIKTSNNIYLVFEQFPSTTLKEYIDKNKLAAHDKSELMHNLAKAVLTIHKKQVAIVGLSLINVYVKDKNEIFLGDWSLAKQIKTNQKIQFSQNLNNYQFVANEIKDGVCGLEADVYSLGKLFKAIETSNINEYSSFATKRLNSFLNKMMNQNYRERPSMKEVLAFFQNKPEPITSISVQSKAVEQQNKSKRVGNTLKIKQTVSLQTQTQKYIGENRQERKQIWAPQTPQVQSSKKFTPSSPAQSNSSLRYFPSEFTYKNNTPIVEISSPTLKKKSSINISSKNTLELTEINKSRSSRSDRRSQQYEQSYKTINKKRNLAFLLLDLSQFVVRMEFSTQLAFLLLKSSFIIIKGALEKWEKQSWNTDQGTRFTEILEKQATKLAQTFANMKSAISEDSIGLPILKRQLEQDNSVNERYLKQKIIQFSKDVVIYCEKNLNQKQFNSKLIDTLFKTYLILKKVEEGTFQKFWEKVCNEDYAYLSNQKFLKDEKNLGFRYLKSRIAQILSKK